MFCPWCGAPRRDVPRPSPAAPAAEEPQRVQPQEERPPEEPSPVTQPLEPPPSPARPAPPPPPAKPPKKGEKGRKLLWVLGAVVLLAAILAAVVGVRHYQRNQEYKLQLETGLRYLEDGDYREAILAFTAAIEINPKSADAYAGMGKYKTAVEDYLQALELDSGNPEVYLGLANAYMELDRRGDAIDILEKGEQATGDERIIQWLELLRDTTGTGGLSGMVSEYLPQGGTAPLSGAQVRLYREIDDIPRLIRQDDSDSTGNFSLDELAEGTYMLRVEASGHLSIETEEEIVENEENYTELFLLIPDVSGSSEGGRDDSGKRADTFTAQVTNAINGEGVANVQVVLRSGWNNRKGRAAAETTTDSGGSFTLNDLKYGYYTAETSAEDFITAYHNVAVLPEEYAAQWDLPMSPMLAAGETRIVLTWGEFPYDLDSHLVGADFHVFYSDRDAYDNQGQHRVNLDLDDTSSYGPETTTIYQGVDGAYTYSVHDFSNGGQTSSTALSTSGATVRVYQQEGLTATYHVPAGQVGTTWAVFRIHASGRLEPINVVSNIYPTN